MNDREQEGFEADLRRLKPTTPPEDLVNRLAAALPTPRSRVRPGPNAERKAPWAWWFGWLWPVAASATLVASLAAWHWSRSSAEVHAQPAIASTQPSSRPDDVEIDRQLVAAYDAVARLPNGQPVRLLCREWRDEVIFRDPAKGIVIESQTPRLEVVPVSFDTY